MLFFKQEPKDSFARDFSDTDIDRFVAHLREQNLSVNESEALAALRGQGHDDPRRIRQRKLPKELRIGENSDLFRLFEAWEQRPADAVFDPLEFMTEHIELAHEAFLRDSAAQQARAEAASYQTGSQPNGVVRGTDPTQRALKRFETELESASARRLRGQENRSEDAAVRIGFSEDKIRAWLFLFPPIGSGAEITEEQIRQILADKQIIFGVDEYLLARAVHERLYFRILPIAVGTDPSHGRSGWIEELVRRERCTDIREDAHGNVNYKELNRLNNVKAGDPICNIGLPTKSSAGRSVLDEPVPGRDGAAVKVPAGKNTKISEDGTLLLACVDGEVVYRGGKFEVQRLLTIDGNVDIATGNIDFAGDVLIKGDIRDGFSVHAGGSLQILGTAEGAQLSADGDLTIRSGMIGGQRGKITCGGTLRCKYLEHCTVYAKGSIYADTIVLSDVSSEDDIVIMSERGGISGGMIKAVGQVRTAAAGAKNNPGLTTQIVLGATPQLLADLNDLEERRRMTERNAKRIELNVRYIESSAEQQTEERIQLLGKLKVQYQITLLQLSQIERQISTINEKLQAPKERCSFSCTHIYPTVTVTIGEHSLSFTKERDGCTVRESTGELRVFI